ncbi:MAG: hypothetical protein LBH72_01480 [Proteiniphilum sp.]|jgi:hypothetical protein|nr:hypothetical protein [Proteiniphilum sp.]
MVLILTRIPPIVWGIRGKDTEISLFRLRIETYFAAGILKKVKQEAGSRNESVFCPDVSGGTFCFIC